MINKERKKIYTAEDFDIGAFVPIDLISPNTKQTLSKHDGELMFDGLLLDMNTFVHKVFAFALSLMIEDIVDNNATIGIHTVNNKELYIAMRLVHAKRYHTTRAKVVDMTYSSELGARMYPLHMIMIWSTTDRTKKMVPIMVDDVRRQRIKEHTKEGMNYGDGKNDMSLLHYVSLLMQHILGIKQRSIHFMLRTMWYRLWRNTKLDADTYCKLDDGWAYVGRLRKFNQMTGRLMRYRLWNKLNAWQFFLKRVIPDLCYAVMTLEQYDQVKDNKVDKLDLRFYTMLLLAKLDVTGAKYFFTINKELCLPFRGLLLCIASDQIKDIKPLLTICDIQTIELIGRHWKELPIHNR